MSSRLDYLSKYLKKDDSLRKKKKRNKRNDEQTSSQSYIDSSVPVIVENGIQTAEVINPEEEHTQNNEIECEDAPVTVDSGSGSRQNMGFKRIDNGNIVERNSIKLKDDKNQQDNTLKSTQDIEEMTQGNTIYRDQSGRIVNLHEKRAELKNQKELEKQEKIKLREAINLGDIDKLRKEDLVKNLESAQRFDYSKTNEEYVKHMKQKDQFDDPLLAFGSKEAEESTSVTGRPMYDKGVQPVNRFNVSAGYFWDGIDRSNGFERKLVTKRNELKMKNVIEKNSKESYSEYDYE